MTRIARMTRIVAAYTAIGSIATTLVGCTFEGASNAGDPSDPDPDGGRGGHHLALDGATVTSEQAGGGGAGFIRAVGGDVMLGTFVSPSAS